MPSKHTGTYDPACDELARHFLQSEESGARDPEPRIRSLAGAIQEAAEAWFENNPTEDDDDGIAF